MDLKEQRKQTFESCLAAAKDPAHHTLTMHMWEYWQGNHNKIDKKGIEARSHEVGQILSVMGNDEGASYTDQGYLHVDHAAPLPKDRSDHFGSRYQSATKDGIIGLATTPLVENSGVLPFALNSHTGLLMLDTTPVFCMPHDGWSVYYDSKEHLPTDNAWKEAVNFIKQHTPESFQASFAHFHFLEHPEAREALAGKLTMMRRIKYHPLDHITAMQWEKPDQLYCSVDPLSGEVQARAREAYTQLGEELHKNNESIAPYKHPEVNVNATLEKAAGILAYNDDINHPFDPDKPLKENLQDNIELARTLYRAIREYDQLNEAMRKHHIQHQPTIMIYQPGQKERSLVHAEPTTQMRSIVEGILRKEIEEAQLKVKQL